MRKAVLAVGVYLFVLGVAMPLLLNELSTVTFRGDIPPWRAASVPFAIGGVIVMFVGFSLSESESITSSRPSRYFGLAILTNILASVVFIAPVLIPTLEFPILITRWPGIYMVAAYISFLLVAVLGSFAWALLYSNSKSLFNRVSFDKDLFVLHFVLYQVGIYGLTFFMFWGGYTGSVLNYGGGGDALVGIVMELNVIPSAVFIYTLMFAALLGVLVILTGHMESCKNLPIYENQESKQMIE